MDLQSQTWYSTTLRSFMKLEQDNGTGIISGIYHTAPGQMTAPLIGKFNNTGAGAFGWTVSWPSSPKYQITSQTSWVGDMVVIKGVYTIVTSWMIREQLNGNPYWSTVSGCENYTQTPPSEETIEAHKHRRAPHPI